MGKVRYKEPSKHFAENAVRKTDSNLRSSVGQEGHVGEYYYLSLDILIPYAKQARRTFDESQILELAATIKEQGILNPLLVVVSLENPGKFEVVSGERRLRAARLVGLDKIPCTIINSETAEEIALIENIQRADLHPIEIGDAIHSLIGSSKWGDVSKLAEKIGKDQSTVSHYLSYAQLPNSVKNFLISHNIRSRDVLRKIAKEDSEKSMMDILKRNNLHGVVKNVLRISFLDGKFKIQDRSLRTLEEEHLIVLREKLKEIDLKIDSMLG